LLDEFISTIVGFGSQTPNIVPTSSYYPSKANLWISIEKNKIKGV
jgi:hypothetical protein